MTATHRHKGTTAELLARIDCLQQQQMLQEQKHREEIQALTAIMRDEISMLKGGTPGTTSVRVRSASTRTRLSSMMGKPFGGRTKRLGIGLGLALLLLVAPSQSAVTHAAYEDTSNTAYGTGALPVATTTGTGNSAFGHSALAADTTGEANTAIGEYALASNTTGQANTASGKYALTSNTTGQANTASGSGALYHNTSGVFNTASGIATLHYNTGGAFNTAFGSYALEFNVTGTANTASGFDALSSNTTGHHNTASGDSALYANTSGVANTASGFDALNSNSTGDNNTAVGYGAGYTDNPANANTTGSNNTFIGYQSGPGTPSEITNATAIGANAIVSESNSIVLGGTGANTQRIGVGTTTPHSAFQIAKGFLQLRPITGSAPPAAHCQTADDAGRLVVRTDGNTNLYICNGTTWIGK